MSTDVSMVMSMPCTCTIAPLYQVLLQAANADALLDICPALDGFYSIPQETRLLFSAQAAWPGLRVSGLQQMSSLRVERLPSRLEVFEY